MDIFESALNKASSIIIKELSREGYKELREIGGSLFHTLQQEGLPDKAIIITVHVDPDIGTSYKFMRARQYFFARVC